MTTSSKPEAVGVAQVARSYGGRHPVSALRDVSFTVGRGEVVALMGDNGAGKSTLLDLICGLGQPDEGRVRVLGRTPKQAILAGELAAMLQTGGLLPELTVGETVRLTADLCHRPEAAEPAMAEAGVAGIAQGRPATEADTSPFVGPESPRGGGENRAFDFVDRGVRAVAARFAPTVHGAGDHGFISLIVAAARQHGVSGYVGDGTHGWAAVSRPDAARLVRLGLEGAPAGTRMHAASPLRIFE